jgi:hypothetical protein
MGTGTTTCSRSRNAADREFCGTQESSIRSHNSETAALVGRGAMTRWKAPESPRRTARRARIRTQTGLCRRSNRSLFASRNRAAKRFGEAGDRGGIFSDMSRFRAAETALSRVSAGKAAESQRLFRRRQETGIAQECVVVSRGLKLRATQFHRTGVSYLRIAFLSLGALWGARIDLRAASPRIRAPCSRPPVWQPSWREEVHLRPRSRR